MTSVSLGSARPWAIEETVRVVVHALEDGGDVMVTLPFRARTRRRRLEEALTDRGVDLEAITWQDEEATR